jgi:hypothetical protein
MVEDKIIWQGIKYRTTTKMTNEDFKLMCTLHSKHFNHKYHEPCTCNKSNIRKWIEDLDKALLN